MNFEVEVLADFCEVQEEINIFSKDDFGDTFFPEIAFRYLIGTAE